MPIRQTTPTTKHFTATMARLNIASWLSSSSSSRDETGTKKLNRRSFAGFSTAASPPSKTRGSNEPTVKAAAAAHDTKPAAAHGKAERPSTSSTTQASESGASAAVLDLEDDSTSITALADKISRETAKLDKYLKDQGLPMPGFGVDAPDDFPRLPDEMQKSRLDIIHATKQLRDLTVGPREGVRWGVQNVGFSSSPPHTQQQQAVLVVYFLREEGAMCVDQVLIKVPRRARSGHYQQLRPR